MFRAKPVMTVMRLQIIMHRKKILLRENLSAIFPANDHAIA